MPEYVAVIPARAGSKGLPNKTLRALAGRPLLDYTLDAAGGSSRISSTWVTTEDSSIAARACFHGSGVIDRPTHLAEDDVSMDQVLLHAVEALEARAVLRHSDDAWLVLLQPTSPLRTAGDIDAAIAFLEDSGGRGLVSVVEHDREVYKFMTVGSDGFLRGMVSPEAPFTRRQDCPRVVRPNGAIYIYHARAFVEAGGFYFQGVVPFVMPPERSVDIDSAGDLDRAAELMIA
jgi:CMP-N-acetylneuraminic acid synthetase